MKRPRLTVVPDREDVTLQRGEAGVELILGGAHVQSAELVDTLGTVLEMLLVYRSWADGEYIYPLDDQGRSLVAERRGEACFARVVDRTGHPLGERVVVDLGALLERLLEVSDEPDSTRIERLLRFACEVARGPLYGRRRRAEKPDPPPPQSGELLPVAQLRHLAWRRKWRREMPGLERVLMHEGQLWCSDDAGLSALDPRTGRLLWNHPELVGLAGGLARDASGLCALDTDGDTLWRAEGLSPRQARRLGKAWLLDGEEAVDAKSGAPLWRCEPLHGGFTGIEVAAGAAWATAEDGMLYRLGPKGQEFRVPLPAEPASPPRLTEAGLLLVLRRVPTGGGLLWLLHPGSGRLIREVELPEGFHPTRGLWPSPTPVCVRGSQAIVVTDDGDKARVLLVDLETGDLRCIQRARSVPSASWLGEGPYLKYADGGVAAFDHHGQKRWQISGDDPDASLCDNAPPGLCRGLLLVPGTRVRALDPRDGREVYALDCGELVPSWLHAHTDGALTIREHDAVAHYPLGGHLSVVK